MCLFHLCIWDHVLSYTADCRISFYTPNTTPPCPGENIIYYCTTNTTRTCASCVVNMVLQGSGFLCNDSRYPSDQIVLSTSTNSISASNSIQVCGNISAMIHAVSIVDGTFCLTTVLTIRNPQYYNGTVSCSNGNNTNTLIGKYTLNIEPLCKLVMNFSLPLVYSSVNNHYHITIYTTLISVLSW